MSVTRPRGPLPARVYWFRRLLVLGLAFGLVLGIGQVLGESSDGASDPAARQAAGVPTSAAASPDAVSTADARAGVKAAKRKPGKKKTKKPLPMPTGPCQDSDVRVAPTPQDTYADDEIRLALELTTFESPACSWEVTPDSIVVRLTSGNDRIWSSQDCPGAVPTEPVTLRRRTSTVVEVTWSGRRSDADCSRTTGWAEPGYYHVTAAAMGSEPDSKQFRLLPPAPVTITPTPTPRSKSKDTTVEERQGGRSGRD